MLSVSSNARYISNVIEPKKLLNFRDYSGYELLSREWLLKVIIFLLSLFSILNTDNTSKINFYVKYQKLSNSALRVTYFSAPQSITAYHSCLRLDKSALRVA